MIREFITNKWFIGAIALLIIFAGACYLWYQHTTAPYRQEAAEAAKLLRQRETTQKAENNEAEQAADAPMEGSTPTAEIPITETTTAEVRDTEAIQAQQPADAAETTEAADVPVSPFGFGSYPEVPADYPSTVSWERDQRYLPEALRPQSELLSRVLVQLWTEGNKNFRGGSTYNGKIYPHYHNTVYVRFAEYQDSEGKTVRYPARGKSGPFVKYTEADLLDPPPHLRILDLDSSGIDPYQYLDLPLKRRK